MATVLGQTVFLGVAPRLAASSKATRTSSKHGVVCRAYNGKDIDAPWNMKNPGNKARAAASVALTILVSTAVDISPVSAATATRAAAPVSDPDTLLERLYSKQTSSGSGGSSRLAGTETATLLAEASAKKSPALKANSPKATATAPKAKPAALKSIAAPKPAAAAPKAKVTAPKPSGATSKAQIAVAPKAKVAVPVSTNSQAISTLKATSGKAAPANLAEPKFAELTAVKGGKGFVIDNEASRPKTRLAALSTSAGALGAGLFGLGKLAGAGAAKGGATKAVAASATSADVAEAVAVLVAGGAVGQTGTSVITKNSRIRKIYATPEGELPLLAQAAVGLSVPASLLFAIFAFLQSL